MRGVSGSVTAASGGVGKLMGTIFLGGLVGTSAGCGVKKGIGDGGVSGGGGGNGGDGSVGGGVRMGGCGDCNRLMVRSAYESHAEGGGGGPQTPAVQGDLPSLPPPPKGRVGSKIHAMAGRRDPRPCIKPSFNYVQLPKAA